MGRAGRAEGRSTQVTDSCEPRVPGEAKRFGGRRGHIRM